MTRCLQRTGIGHRYIDIQTKRDPNIGKRVTPIYSAGNTGQGGEEGQERGWRRGPEWQNDINAMSFDVR